METENIATAEEQGNPYLSALIKGLIGGAVFVVISMLMYISGLVYNMWANILYLLLIILVIVFTLIWGIKGMKKKFPAALPYGRALVYCLIMVAGVAAVQSVYNVVLNTVIDKDYQVRVMEKMKEQMQAMGEKYGNAEQIEKNISRFDDAIEKIQNEPPGILDYIIESFQGIGILGLIISLIIAAVYRTKIPSGNSELV